MAELPKLPKIKPGIKPKNIMGSSGSKVAGIKSPGRKKAPLVENISSKNLFTNIQRRSPEVANTRGARTLTNLMSVFGSVKNEKVIRRELQLLRNSLVETFEIAKLLRTSLSTVGGDKPGGLGGAAGKSALLAGLGIGLWTWWKKTFGKKDDGGDGPNVDASQVKTEEGNIVQSTIQNVKEGLQSLIPKKEESDETKEVDETNNFLQPVVSFFEGLQFPTIEQIGTAIVSTGAAIWGFLNLFKPNNFYMALRKKWGLGDNEPEVASGDTTTNVNEEVSSESDGIVKDETLIASTDTKGLLSNNFDGMKAESVTGKNSKDKKKDKLNLSDQDFKDLGLAVSGEAERGTDDELAVAASILNRVASPHFPNTVGEVIKSKTSDGKHEYEAFDKGTAVHDKKLVDFLKSEEGQKGIIEALERLQGRTDFKGQDQLKNRVPEEDPMFSKKGNFFHYFWQSGDGRTKPKDWTMPNYDQFINKQNEINGKKNSDKVSSVQSPTNGSGFVPIILGGNDNMNVKAADSKSVMVDSSSPKTNGPKLAFFGSGNPDSNNLSAKSLLNITG